MDLDLFLWTGGMVFTVGVLAAKVGFGLGFGRFNWRITLLVYAGYLVLFVVAAVLSDRLISVLESVLRAGPCLHVAAAAIMMAWGLFTLTGTHSHGPPSPRTPASAWILVAPCPACVSAIVFSTWAALHATQWPAPVVGCAVGLGFATLSSVLQILVTTGSRGRTSGSSRIGLGLTMIAVGLYFIGSMILPAKIHEATALYSTFAAHNDLVGWRDSSGVVGLLATAGAFGYLVKGKRRVDNG